MFDCFFEQYKDEIHVEKSEKDKNKIIIMIVIFLLFEIILSISIMLNRLNVVSVISSLIVGIDIICIVRYSNKASNEKDLEHKKTIPIIKLLKSDTYGLDNIKGVEWLIKCCIDKSEEKKLEVIGQGIIIAIITLSYGIILNDLRVFHQFISTTIIFIASILMFLMLSKLTLFIVETIIYPDKKIYLELKSELEYIKINSI